MKKMTKLSLLLAGMALTGCVDNKANTSEQTPHSGRKITKTVRQRVTGEWVGRTLLPRSGETRDQYEARLNYLNEMNQQLNARGDFQPILSILTEKGQNMYSWAAKSIQLQKTGRMEDFNPATDRNLIMARQMAKGGVVYQAEASQSIAGGRGKGTSAKTTATVRRGRAYDF